MLGCTYGNVSNYVPDKEKGAIKGVDKKQMTEEDIKLQFITPAITAKWGLDRITMETKITAGKINLKGNFVFREKPRGGGRLRSLYQCVTEIIVETKDNKKTVSHGLQQAITLCPDARCAFCVQFQRVMRL